MLTHYPIKASHYRNSDKHGGISENLASYFFFFFIPSPFSIPLSSLLLLSFLKNPFFLYFFLCFTGYDKWDINDRAVTERRSWGERGRPTDSLNAWSSKIEISQLIDINGLGNSIPSPWKIIPFYLYIDYF